MMKHSQHRTEWVAGRIAGQHSDIHRDQLRRIVADALEAALIHDHDQVNPPRPRGRADGMAGGLRADGGSTTMTQRHQKHDAAERLRARQDAALAEIRSAHQRSRGYTRADAKGTRPQAQPEPERPATTAEDAAEAIRTAHKRRK